jgi:hypothetical protein
VSMNWNLAAVVLSVSGAALGMCGTLMMAHAYHANGIVGFVMTVISLPRIFYKGGPAGTRDFWAQQASRGSPAQEDRGYSIAGLTLIFLGFFLQVLGSICSYAAT